jgi:hypothetical protein
MPLTQRRSQWDKGTVNLGTRLVLSALSLVSVFVAFRGADAAITDTELSKRMLELKDDNVKWNCSKAMEILTPHCGEVKVQKALLARLSSDDPQEREAVLLLLMGGKGFKPDKTFMGILLKRMHHWGRPLRMVDGPAGDAGADFLIAHATEFGDQIAAEISDTFTIKDYSLWVQYAVARGLAKGGVLDKYASKYTRTFFRNLSIQLKSDDIPNNAELATMTFLFLGKLGVPTLQDVAKHSDDQGRQIAKLLLDYFGGKLSIRKLNEKLGSAGFIGFDANEGEYDLDDCDLTQHVVGPHYFRFRPGAQGQ